MSVRDLLRPAGLLTLSRIPLGVAFLILAADQPWALAILAAAATSDVLDGAVARARHETSAAGEVADPIADKFFALCAVTGLLRAGLVDAVSAAALLTREFGLMVLFVHVTWQGGPRGAVKALPLGKVTTVVQFLAVCALVGRSPVAMMFVSATAGFGILALAAYWDRELTARGLRPPRNRRRHVP